MCGVAKSSMSTFNSKQRLRYFVIKEKSRNLDSYK